MGPTVARISLTLGHPDQAAALLLRLLTTRVQAFGLNHPAVAEAGNLAAPSIQTVSAGTIPIKGIANAVPVYEVTVPAELPSTRPA